MGYFLALKHDGVKGKGMVILLVIIFQLLELWGILLKNTTSKTNIVIGWVVITMTYLITFTFSHLLYRLLFQIPADHNWTTSGIFMGIFMLTIPYIIGGKFVRKTTIKPIKTAIWVSVVPAFSEKLLLLWIGAAFVITDPSIGATTSMSFLRGDGGLPFFTVPYMALSVLSISICIFVASYKKTFIE
jgi:hypothetical protein